MLSRWSLLLSILSTLPAVLADQNNVFTANPTSNSSGSTPTWRLGQEVTITWKTSLGNLRLGYFSNSTPTSLVTFYTALGPDQNIYDWIVDVNGSDWSQNNTEFFLSLSNQNTEFLSMPVTILEAEIPKENPGNLTSSTLTSTATAVSTTSTNSGPSASTTDARTSDPAAQAAESSEQPSAKSRPSGGAIAGIVVGVLAAVAIFAGALLFLLLRRRRGCRSDGGRNGPRRHIAKDSISDPYEPYGGAVAAQPLSPDFAANPRPIGLLAEKVGGVGDSSKDLGPVVPVPAPVWEKKRDWATAMTPMAMAVENGRDGKRLDVEHVGSREAVREPLVTTLPSEGIGLDGGSGHGFGFSAELDAPANGLVGPVEIAGSEVPRDGYGVHRTTLWPSSGEGTEERAGLLERRDWSGQPNSYIGDRLI